jgi:hypothetical protein
MKPQALIGLLVLIATLYGGHLILTDKNTKSKPVPKPVPKIYVTKVAEDNYKVNCTEFDTFYRAGDYLNIPSICFENYGITDAMIERAIKSQELSTNPCNK